MKCMQTSMVLKYSLHSICMKWILPHCLWTRNPKLKLHSSHPIGKYKFNAVPFGLAQAPTSFQQLISMALQDCGDSAMVYLDDIIIFSKNEHRSILNNIEDHLQETQRGSDSSSRSPNVISLYEKSIIYVIYF